MANDLEVGAPVRYVAHPTSRGIGRVTAHRTKDPGTLRATDRRWRVRWPDGYETWYRRISLTRVGPAPERTHKPRGNAWPKGHTG